MKIKLTQWPGRWKTGIVLLILSMATTQLSAQVRINGKVTAKGGVAVEAASVVVKGSLVKTNLGLLFVSVALGKVSIGELTVMALSPQSPLGQQLMGLSVGESAIINNNIYMIESID